MAVRVPSTPTGPLPPMRRLGIVADDLTGGLETAAMLVAKGVATGFATDAGALDASDDMPVMVIAQKTRVIAPQDAVSRMEAAARALLAGGWQQIFFKYCATFDSTDRGNIGPVADMLLRVTGARVTLFCPASPQAGRTVYQGHLFVGTQLVSDSPKRFDPLTPMTDPDLVRVLQRQTSLPVGLVAHRQVAAGPQAILAEIERQAADGTRYFIADTIDDADLAHLAAVAALWPLMTGNAPILQHYPALWRAAAGDAAPASGMPPLAPVRGPGVVLAGSCAERTLEQLAEFERWHKVLRLDLAAQADPEAAVAAALAFARAHRAEGPVAIATSGGPADVEMAQRRHGREGAALLAERILGSLAVALHEDGVRRFVVAGGETSGAVLEHLRIRRLRVGPYGGPGIGSAVTEGPDPIGLCLKSGKLGAVDLFSAALAAMERG